MKPNLVDVLTFPKKCPHCRVEMYHVKKMNVHWLECRNPDCVYLAKVYGDDDRATPYIYGYTHH